MSTSLGHDLRAASAAYRAGIARPTDLDHFTAWSDEEEAEIPLTGHVASAAAAEAEGIGKVLALAERAFEQLLAPERVSPAERVGLLLALPDYAARQPSGSDDEDHADFVAGFRRQCQDTLGTTLVRATGNALSLHTLKLWFGDQAAFFLALRAAFEDLAAGKFDRCFVGAVDSLLEPATLQWALDHDRLKTAAQPAGFSPGEAAVFLDLMTDAAARASGRRALALLHPPEVEREPEREDGPQGTALAAVIARALGARPRSDVGLILGNLNGEVARAQDWGFALSRLIGTFPDLGSARTMFPCSGFGDTGGAAAPLAVGIATQALTRGYAQGNDVLVWISSDSLLQGAVLVSRPDAPPDASAARR